MSERDIAVILSKLETITSQVAELRGDVKNLFAHGCARAEQHAEGQHDHEQRMRALEIAVAYAKPEGYGKGKTWLSVLMSNLLTFLSTWASTRGGGES